MNLPVSPARARPRSALGVLVPGLFAMAAASATHAATPRPEACALAASPPGDALVDVPFDVVDGRLYVDARVNGAGPFRFAVDTGASGIARADSRLVDTLGLPADAAVANSDGVTTAPAATARLRSLALGALRHDDVVAISRDYNARQSKAAAFDGILARGFFADGLLTIDYPRRRLRFSRGPGLTPDHSGALGYARPFRVAVSIGGLQVEAQLDTGANVVLVLPQATYDALGSTAVMTPDRLGLGNGAIDGGRTRVRGPLRIGALSLPEVEARVSTRFPEVLVGAHALQHGVVLIDQRSRQVAICVPPAPPPASRADGAATVHPVPRPVA